MLWRRGELHVAVGAVQPIALPARCEVFADLGRIHAPALVGSVDAI